MAQVSNELEGLARQLLAAGMKAPQVEQELVRRGLGPPAAARAVDEALKSKIAESAAAEERPFSWLRVLLGLTVAGVALAGVYVGLVNAPDGVLAGAGALRGALRGAIIGGGAGLAIGALNMVRSEFMRLMRPGK
jgi:uncharacterized membrane protein YidH (DUF202 family)